MTITLLIPQVLKAAIGAQESGQDRFFPLVDVEGFAAFDLARGRRIVGCDGAR